MDEWGWGKGRLLGVVALLSGYPEMGGFTPKSAGRFRKLTRGRPLSELQIFFEGR
jgi:hypothetical protein